MLFASGGFAGCTAAPSSGTAAPGPSPTGAQLVGTPVTHSSVSGVSGDSSSEVATAASDDRREYLTRLGSTADFDALAAEPLDTTMSGARSVKTVVDRVDGNAVYFQDSERYPLHWDFASNVLSGGDLPIVPMLATFNETEYASPSRRFLLGAVTYYAGPDVYCYEIAPYDSATTDMIAEAFALIAANTSFGDRLVFHPTSEAVERVASALPAGVPVVTTDTLYAEIDYQPLNAAESYGRLRFVAEDDLEDAALSFRDIVVLERIPNDITVLMGIITAEFQTPLSHLNVLSRNRGTPNMALRNAFDDPGLRALEGKWVRFEVGLTDYTLEEVAQETADAWWEQHKPSEVQVPNVDLSVTDLRDIGDTVDLESLSLYDAIHAATRAFGGKAAHYGALTHIDGLPIRPAFAVPVYYYFQFMAQHGFDRQVEAMLADPEFQADPAVREERLADLRSAMKDASLDSDFERLLVARLRADFPQTRMKFRSSTNAEDLDGFTGAGLYESAAGAVHDLDDPVADAVRKVWASVWSMRAFEERSYRSIDHLAVGMALLVNPSFPDEEANGVALTNNPFDPTGVDPAFYVNVQAGETSVVQPPSGTTTDAFLLYYDQPDQPITYISHSDQVEDGRTVLADAQVSELGAALAAIREYFAPAYAPTSAAGGSWWAMDVEFKFDGEPGEDPQLYIKQARPYQ